MVMPVAVAMGVRWFVTEEVSVEHQGLSAPQNLGLIGEFVNGSAQLLSSLKAKDWKWGAVRGPFSHTLPGFLVGWLFPSGVRRDLLGQGACCPEVRGGIGNP